jgi:REP element-mobilizing transposase RayT
MKFREYKQYRHKAHDYSEPAYYFITICTHKKILFFGKIKGEEEDARIELSEPGEVAKRFWFKIPNRFSNVELDEFVIMPNHIHGIIKIVRRNAPRRVPTEGIRMGLEPLRRSSLSSIINHYKGNITKWCNRNGYNFAWQPRFYDRIVRNGRELNKIRQYIWDNPAKWSVDRNNPKNI